MDRSEAFARTEMLLGAEAMEKLKTMRVALFGIGGVGGYAAEALARSGVGAMDLIDHDVIAVSNLNRQIIATGKTIGRYKAEVMKERILDINPECTVTTHICFYLPDNKELFDFSRYSYVIDAIDTVTAKIQLVLQAKEAGTPVISCMGTGNKLHPELFTIDDIFCTSVCPLCRVMRRELKKRQIPSLKVLYSREIPITPQVLEDEQKEAAGRRSLPGSISFVPPAAGLMIAGEVIRRICEIS